MKGTIIGAISTILLLLLLCSGVFADVFKYFAWLFTLQYSHPDTSIFVGIIARALTFAVSYSLVGVVFNAFGWFNGRIMKIVYFIISTLFGFVIAYIVWCIEQYIFIIGIVMGAIVFAVIVYFVIRAFGRKKRLKQGEYEE